MTGEITKTRRGRKIVLGILGTLLGLVAVLAVALGFYIRHLGPLPLEAPEKTSVVVLDRQDRLLRAFTTREGRWRLPISVARVDRKFLTLLLTYEDKRFYDHWGVDPLAMARAVWLLLTHGRVVSGGSTLTMQVARLLEPRDKRTLSAKLRQIVRAIQLERRFTKDEILRLYLKLAPYGGNLEGLRAASLAYFGREPWRLTLAQAALLVALPQSPEYRRPDRFPAAARRARDRVLARAFAAGVIRKDDWLAARTEPIPLVRKPFPKLAAHLAREVVTAAPDKAVHRLTIDKGLQRRMEDLAKQHARRLGPHHSVAILVVDHESGEVLAHVGAPDFLDEARRGHVDMIRAVRSPGSALKPFVYALAFDMGLGHPETLIEDRPVRFGAYAPTNFDEQYRGWITLRKALQLSLNVPAVKVLAKVGPARLMTLFHRARLKVEMLGGEVPNLTLALGGLGLRLTDLAQLYSALPRGGTPVRLRYFADRREGQGGKARRGGTAVPKNQKGSLQRLFSSQASWYVTHILAGAPPPANARGGKIAYKTGTSYGFRDAWAVGYDGRHTIAVWAGRPDGTPTPGMTGRRAAAPVLFDAFQRLGRPTRPLPSPPEGVLRVSTAELPPPLRYFEPQADGVPVIDETDSETLRIVFPPSGARVALSDGSGKAFEPLALKAEGGRLPLTWTINGAPIDVSRRRQLFWRPNGKGFARLGVIDAEGRADSVLVRIE